MFINLDLDNARVNYSQLRKTLDAFYQQRHAYFLCIIWADYDLHKTDGFIYKDVASQI